MRSRLRPRSPPSARRRLRQSDEVGVVLVRALEAQEVVVATARAVRIVAAHAGGWLVYGAAARLAVEEHAHGVEHRVLLVAQEPYLLLCVDLGEALLRLAITELEALRQPLYVARRDLDFRIATAVRRTLGARVARAHHRNRKRLLHCWFAADAKRRILREREEIRHAKRCRRNRDPLTLFARAFV